MKILTIDIENFPNIGDVWDLWNQNISLAQLRESARTVAFAAKWHGSTKVEFYSEFHHGRDVMLDKAWHLVNDADVVVHYNGKRHDMPYLRQEWADEEMAAPSPYQEIDLYQVVKRQFKYPSNKLDYVAQRLGLGGKVAHAGHALWVKCMAGDAKAWTQMRKYNKHDVVLTEALYDRLRDWVPNPPNPALYGDLSPGTGDTCPECGSAALSPQGYAYTSISKFQRYRCRDCDRWSRSGRAVARVDVRSA